MGERPPSDQAGAGAIESLLDEVLPREGPNNPDTDPITEANERHEAGDRLGAEKTLMELCQSDLRCLDAHAHLGNPVFDRGPEDAIRHYEVGLRIGELSLGDDFDGVLAWWNIDNRPFLRCMQDFGLCLWRLGRFDGPSAFSTGCSGSIRRTTRE